MGEPAKKLKLNRPDIYDFHDVRDYLNQMISFYIENSAAVTLRKFSSMCGLHHSHVSRMLKGHRTISPDNLNKLVSVLHLNQSEAGFIHLLRDLSESKTQEERITAFNKILSDKNFQKNNKNNIKDHRFLSQWYYPAIRELVRTSEFKNDPKWIRKQLNNKITETEAKNAIEFLLENKYIEKSADKYKVLQSEITCSGGIYRLAASEYHEQLLKIARDSIYDVDRDMRQIMTHTFALPKEDIEKIREILLEASNKISTMDGKNKERDAVYQVSLLAFPLTKVGTL